MSKPHGLPTHATKVFSGIIFDVWQWEQELYDGSKATFESIARPDYVYAVGVLPDRKILLIEDEQPHRAMVLTPAGGKIDQGEDAATAVRREFREEAGYEIGKLIAWHTYQPHSKMDMTIHAFIARDLGEKKLATPEAGERITLTTFTFEEFLALGQSNKLRDWMLRIKLLEAQLDPAKRAELEELCYG